MSMHRTLSLSLLTSVFLACSVHAGAQTITRETAYHYDDTTGLLDWEEVDPGGTHCVRTSYVPDEYGNRKQITVQPCASTAAAATFEARVTTNYFEAKSGAYPLGAFVTRSVSGTHETRAEYDPRFGGATVQTEQATQNAALSISKRTTYDGLGRVQYENVPVHRDPVSGATTESRVDYATVYCTGPHAAPSSVAIARGCIPLYSPQVTVNYASGMLMHISTGEPVAPGTATTLHVESAYFVESTPKDGAGNQVGPRSRVHFDRLHREIVKESETYSGEWVMSMTAYDGLGMAASTWSSFIGRTAAGSFVPPPEELRQWTVARDLLHRPIEQAQSWRGRSTDGAVQVRALLTYNGLESIATLPVGSVPSAPENAERRTITRKNAAGQVAQTVDAYGATVNSAYDPVGNLVRTVDALNNTTTINYTAVSARFKVGMTDPDQGPWTYTYDALGQLKSQTDSRGKTTDMVYDTQGRLVSKTNPTQNSHWFYDKTEGGAWCASGLARLCETRAGKTGQPNVSHQLHGYDNLARPTLSTTTLDRAYASQTTYDTLGRAETLRYPTGFTLRYTYGVGRNAGTLTKVSDNANSARIFWRIDDVAAADVFDARGNLKRSNLGNGLGTNHAFDPISGKAFNLRVGTPASSYVGALNHLYEYDKVDNISRREEKIQGLVETFLYDRLDRMQQYTVSSTTDAAANRTVSLKYNALGNILEKSDVGGYTYNATTRPHAVTAAGGVTYNYDAAGQLLSTDGHIVRSHTWTDFNQPASMSYEGRSVAFTYDHGYKRVKEITTNGSTQRTQYMVHPDNQGGLGFEREETRVNGVLTRNESRHYVSVGGSVVAVVKTLNDSGTVSTDANLTLYWHKDSLGSVVAVSNAGGTVIERMAFDPWGRRLRNTARADSTVDPAHGDRGFTGHEHLDELRLVHMNGRVYDPLVARFLSADSLVQEPGNLQSHNRYSYVINNPLRYTDPSGQCFELVSAAVCKAIAVVVGAAMIADGNKYWKMVGSVMFMWGLSGPNGLIENGLGNAVEVANSAAVNGLDMTASSMFNGGQFGNAFLAGFVGGAASTGGDMEAAFISGFTAGAFNAVGGANLSKPAAVMAHAVVGCASSSVAGGQCGPGAMSAAFAKLATQHPQQNIVVVTLVGGTASVIGGGKFGNGAMTAAMGYLFNALGSGHRRGTNNDTEYVAGKRPPGLIHWETDADHAFAASPEFVARFSGSAEELALATTILLIDSGNLAVREQLYASDVSLPGKRNAFFDIYSIGPREDPGAGRVANTRGSNIYYYSPYHYKPGPDVPNIWVKITYPAPVKEKN